MTAFIWLLAFTTGLPILCMLGLPFPQSRWPLAILFFLFTVIAFFRVLKKQTEISVILKPKGYEISSAILLSILICFYIYFFKDSISASGSGLLSSNTAFLLADVLGSAICLPGLLIWMQVFRKVLLPWLKTLPPSIPALFLAFLVWFCQGGQPLYEPVDNMLLSLVTNGFYSQINQSVFISPVVSLIVSWISSIFPEADGFLLLLEISVFAAVWLMMYFLLSQKKFWGSALIAFFLIIAWNPVLNLYHSNFTIAAGFIGMAGFYGLLYGVGKKASIISQVVSALLLFIGCCIRMESILLITPFAALSYLYILFNSSRNRTFWWKSGAAAVSVILSMGIASASSAAYLSDPEVRDGSVYNDARSTLVDFPAANYEERQTQFESLGISKNDYLSARKLILADTDLFTSDYLQEMADIAEVKQNISFEKFVQSLEKAIQDQKIGPVFTFELAAIPLISLVYLCFCRRKGLNFLYLFLSITGSALIMLYFASLGRLPFRVKQTILFGNWLCLLLVIPVDRKIALKKLFEWVKALMLVSASSLAWWNLTFYIPKLENHLLDVMEAASLRDAPYKPEDLVIWNVIDFDNYLNQHYRKYNKLPSRAVMMKNIPLGDWIYDQPYFKEFLKEAGVENPMKALADGIALYAGTDEIRDMVAEFINEHYDLQVTAVQVGNRDGFPVWKYVTESAEQVETGDQEIQEASQMSTVDEAENAEVTEAGMNFEEELSESELLLFTGPLVDCMI